MTQIQMLYSKPEVGDSIDTVDTPALIIDLDIVDRNIEAMFANFKDKSVTIRPHLKTAKSPVFAKKLIEMGATGICVAKLAEAEVMAQNGVGDILITTEIIGKAKMEKLFDLLRDHPAIRLVVDSKAGVELLASSAKAFQHKEAIMVLIETNVGQNRAGIENPKDVVELANYIKTHSALTFIGVQGYEGHVQLLRDESERKNKSKESMERLGRIVSELKSAGIEVPVVTTGGTGTSPWCAENNFVTEVQPGSFIFMDTAYRNAGQKFEQALHLVATVISKPDAKRAVIDSGYKSLSTDSGAPEVANLAGLTYEPGGDEHGILKSSSGGDVALQIGDRVTITPSHIDTTINLHDFYYCHRNGKIEAILPIANRGKVQ
ncbi:MAG: DSD1 family PLP-dependent enzyme [Cyanobacteria bacterium TGS_CYA1]|nr:DSD1 family PLP-dependent enzyme [Cyanobacteria bacterium TGS_CYA1]